MRWGLLVVKERTMQGDDGEMTIDKKGPFYTEMPLKRPLNSDLSLRAWNEPFSEILWTQVYLEIGQVAPRANDKTFKGSLVKPSEDLAWVDNTQSGVIAYRNRKFFQGSNFNSTGVISVS